MALPDVLTLRGPRAGDRRRKALARVVQVDGVRADGAQSRPSRAPHPEARMVG